MESNGECMINDAALVTPGGVSHASCVILGSYQVQGGRGHELNMKGQGYTLGLCCGYEPHPHPHCMTDLIRSLGDMYVSSMGA